MNPITSSQTQSIVTDNQEDAQRLIEQLDALQPSKQQQKYMLFEQLYPAVERALARQVPQKTVVAELGKMGLHLSIGGFRSLLEVERKQRNENGERELCPLCGANLLRESSGKDTTALVAI